MTELRDHSPGEVCVHGYHLNHWVGLAQWASVDGEPDREWCPGGREVTDADLRLLLDDLRKQDADERQIGI